MYVTKNLYSKYAQYIDLDDSAFFHHSIEAAKHAFESGIYENVSIDNIKKSYTPVIYASSVSSRTADDELITRRKMNERAIRKYLIIDADFNVGEEDQSEELYQKLIALASKHNTKLIMYPTISYPEKPRFRAVLFTKRSLNAAAYYKAMSWLYDELGESATDRSDFEIRSNNNAPVFVNKEQLDRIFDNTDDDSLELLDSKLWNMYTAPAKLRQKKKKEVIEPTHEYDTYKLSRFKMMTAAKQLAKSPRVQEYSTFWPIVYAIARSEIVQQTTEEEAFAMLDILASAAPDETTMHRWQSSNRQMYVSARASLLASRKDMLSITPLYSYSEFKQYLDLGKGSEKNK